MRRMLAPIFCVAALLSGAAARAQDEPMQNARFMGYKTIDSGNKTCNSDYYGTSVQCSSSHAQMFLIQSASFLYTVQDTDDAKAPMWKALSHHSTLGNLTPGSPIMIHTSGRDLFVADSPDGTGRQHRFHIYAVEPARAGAQ